jgi:hypothetical protein
MSRSRSDSHWSRLPQPREPVNIPPLALTPAQVDPDACQDLWFAVLRTAARDLLSDEPDVAADARDFFASTARLAPVCDLLGLDAAWVQRLLGLDPCCPDDGPPSPAILALWARLDTGALDAVHAS